MRGPILLASVLPIAVKVPFVPVRAARRDHMLGSFVVPVKPHRQVPTFHHHNLLLFHSLLMLFLIGKLSIIRLLQ